ncbi:MAG TPA: hypothetical protein VFE23_19320 [Usitatibacter sp.]|jgi:septal ring factor EnvC (AmiA/AmiB activator)|nr:hypothetical protein [Usitatibacter sp.]
MDRTANPPCNAREALIARLDAIAAELREYPQPIARCDAQLGALIEEQDRLRSELARLAQASSR